MKRQEAISDLMTLVKVFDVNYASEEDCSALIGLDANSHSDVVFATRALLLPEFRSLCESEQRRLLALLRRSCQNGDEDFGALFGRLALVFENELLDTREFMGALLQALDEDNVRCSP